MAVAPALALVPIDESMEQEYDDRPRATSTLVVALPTVMKRERSLADVLRDANPFKRSLSSFSVKLLKVPSTRNMMVVRLKALSGTYEDDYARKLLEEKKAEEVLDRSKYAGYQGTQLMSCVTLICMIVGKRSDLDLTSHSVQASAMFAAVFLSHVLLCVAEELASDHMVGCVRFFVDFLSFVVVTLCTNYIYTETSEYNAVFGALFAHLVLDVLSIGVWIWAYEIRDILDITTHFLDRLNVCFTPCFLVALGMKTYLPAVISEGYDTTSWTWMIGQFVLEFLVARYTPTRVKHILTHYLMVITHPKYHVENAAAFFRRGGYGVRCTIGLYILAFFLADATWQTHVCVAVCAIITWSTIKRAFRLAVQAYIFRFYDVTYDQEKLSTDPQTMRKQYIAKIRSKREALEKARERMNAGKLRVYLWMIRFSFFLEWTVYPVFSRVCSGFTWAVTCVFTSIAGSFVVVINCITTIFRRNVLDENLQEVIGTRKREPKSYNTDSLTLQLRRLELEAKQLAKEERIAAEIAEASASKDPAMARKLSEKSLMLMVKKSSRALMKEEAEKNGNKLPEDKDLPYYTVEYVTDRAFKLFRSLDEKDKEFLSGKNSGSFFVVVMGILMVMLYPLLHMLCQCFLPVIVFAIDNHMDIMTYMATYDTHITLLVMGVLLLLSWYTMFVRILLVAVFAFLVWLNKKDNPQGVIVDVLNLTWPVLIHSYSMRVHTRMWMNHSLEFMSCHDLPGYGLCFYSHAMCTNFTDVRTSCVDVLANQSICTDPFMRMEHCRMCADCQGKRDKVDTSKIKEFQEKLQEGSRHWKALVQESPKYIEDRKKKSMNDSVCEIRVNNTTIEEPQANVTYLETNASFGKDTLPPPDSSEEEPLESVMNEYLSDLHQKQQDLAQEAADKLEREKLERAAKEFKDAADRAAKEMADEAQRLADKVGARTEQAARETITMFQIINRWTVRSSTIETALDVGYLSSYFTSLRAAYAKVGNEIMQHVLEPVKKDGILGDGVKLDGV